MPIDMTAHRSVDEKPFPQRVGGSHLQGVHPNSFRPGEKAMIVTIDKRQPEGCDSPRHCFMVIYPDGVLDAVPISEVVHGNYEIVDGV